MRTKIILVLSFLTFCSARADEDPMCMGLDPEKEVVFPDPVYCNRYFKCFNGVFSEEECPRGLYFSELNKGCVDEEYSECMGGSGTPPTSTTTMSPTTASTTTTPSTTISTITTSSPTISTTTVSPTTISTTTTSSPTTSTTTQSTTTPDIDPRCIGDETSYWPHPEYCNLFIECYKGNSYEMSCPPDLYFSEKLQKCVSAGESECCFSNAVSCE